MLSVAMVLTASALAVEGDSYDNAYEKSRSNDKPLVVLVGADWCPACQNMKHGTMTRVRQDGTLQKVEFAYVNSDQEPQLARQLMRGQSIPQLIAFSKTARGWKREQLTGLQSAHSVQSLIERHAQMQAQRATVDEAREAMAQESFED